MKNCIDCKNKEIRHYDESLSPAKAVRVCLAGKDAELNEFMSQFRNIPYTEIKVEMDCFESRDFDKSLDKILGMLDELIKEKKIKE